MSSRSVVNVDFVAEYKGAQKLSQAQKDMASLRGGVEKLGRAFVGVFAARELFRFAKDAVAAFAHNEKSVKLLTNTLKNLGLGFDALSVNEFIDHLALATGRTKEELIPAFQGLVVATGSVSKAQAALKVAMDVSAATGKDLQKVQIAMSKGFLGNTTSLTRLGAGLDKATLATGDMNLIMAKLSATFGGSAATAVNTFQGKMDRLNVALIESKVNIGTGLVEAFTNLAGGGSIDKTTSKMLTFSKVLGDLIATLGGARKGLGNEITFKFGIIPMIKPGLVLDKYPAQESPAARAAKVAAELKTAQAKLKVDQTSAKALTDQKKAAADRLALERSQLSLKLAGLTVDMQNIEIQAALQRGQTEQINNVLLLQRAILTGNADQASILAQKVLIANGLVMDVNGNITALAGAKNPFKDWPTASQAAIDQLKKVADYLATIKDKTITITIKTITTTCGGGGGSGGGGSGGGKNTDNTLKSKSTAVTDSQAWALELAKKSVISGIPVIDGNGGGSAGNSGLSSVVSNAINLGKMSPGELDRGSNPNVQRMINININAAPGVVVETTQDASTNGTAVTVNRNNPFGMYSSS